MADPQQYAAPYSFSGFQANNPTSPLPAPALDGEFAAIVVTTAQIIAALAEIRRSDGALKNGIVTFDSFESGLQLLLDPTNGQLVAAAVATAQAAQAGASTSATAAASSAASALTQALAAAASAATVNLSLYLARSNNLAGLGSLVTSRANLGLGSVATFDVGTGANNIVQLDGSAKIPALDGSQLTGMDLFPVGGVAWFPATTPPAGFRQLNGALISRTGTFARLYAFAAASGNIVSEATWAASNNGAFSTGDLSTTFRVPDLRSEFIRNYDDGRGIEPGRAFGSNEADSLKNHTHVIQNNNGTANSSGGSPGIGAAFTQESSGVSAPNNGGTETRPRNVSLLACIKY